MMAPAFWQRDTALARLLSPLGAVTRAATARRMRRPGWRAPVPVLCCGNASVGGAGKTILVLDLARRLQARGVVVHALTRGYGGSARNTVRVDPVRHSAGEVGDEPLLLAEALPTWVGADRARAARAAVAAGAQALLMDDGLQNPALVKTASLLVVDGGAGFGNGRLLPAGPLREPVAAAAARCRAAVLIGEDRTDAAAWLAGLPLLRARLVPAGRLDGQRVFAFAGIGRPAKFFDSLRDAGADVAGSEAFPDHHPYVARDAERLLRRAAELGARPVTTAKDAVRLPPHARAVTDVFHVRLEWADERELSALLADIAG